MVNVVHMLQHFYGNKINIAHNAPKQRQSESFSIFIFARAISLCTNRFLFALVFPLL